MVVETAVGVGHVELVMQAVEILVKEGDRMREVVCPELDGVEEQPVPIGRERYQDRPCSCQGACRNSSAMLTEQRTAASLARHTSKSTRLLHRR